MRISDWSSDVCSSDLALMEAALEAGADDVEMGDDGSALVSTSFTDFHAVNEALVAAGFKGEEADIAMIPSISAPLTDLETAQKVMRLIDALEDLDDAIGCAAGRERV